MTPSYAGVYLLDAPYAIDREYDYLIPRSLCDVVHRGSFVTVPFGNGNRKHLALVVEVKDSSPYPKHKPVLSVSSDSIALYIMSFSSTSSLGTAITAPGIVL